MTYYFSGPESAVTIIPSSCLQEPWQEFCSEPPCGQLNPTNNHTYTLLSHLYAELRSIFHPLHFFHFGGSEVGSGDLTGLYTLDLNLAQ